jgi:biotin carboxylase
VMTAALIREHLRVPGMGTTTARLFRDKLAMRVKASAAGIDVPGFVHVLNEDELRGFMAAVPPPWVLKPRSDVSAVGIQKLDTADLVWRAIEALDARPLVTERSSYYLLERFVPGDVYHVDALVQNGAVVFAGAHRYRRPPMEVAHQGGVFVTSTVERGSDTERALDAVNRRLLQTLGLVRGASHAEFIQGTDGRLYFLEVAARVGGAYIAEMLEAASGINLWREWAKVELGGDEVPYQLPPTRCEYAGVALALARQEWPDTDGYGDPEIVHRVKKRHHVGLVVRSAVRARFASPPFDRRAPCRCNDPGAHRRRLRPPFCAGQGGRHEGRAGARRARRPQVPLDRSCLGRPGVARNRRAGRPPHLLRRHGIGRRLEVDGRGRDLDTCL